MIVATCGSTLTMLNHDGGAVQKYGVADQELPVPEPDQCEFDGPPKRDPVLFAFTSFRPR
jgi:hypothetical protein